MSSGNFIIGKGLSLKGFNEYIKPNLERHKTEVTDFLSCGENGREKVLISLVGNDGILERIVKWSLEEAVSTMGKNIKESKGDGNQSDPSAYAHQIRDYLDGGYSCIFKTIGVYNGDNTASKIFQNLAVKCSLKDLESQLEETEEKMNDFGKKFKNF
jgi:hypothetical protein